MTPETRDELAAYAERSAGFANRLARAGWEDFSLATDDRSPAELAGDAVARFMSACP